MSYRYEDITFSEIKDLLRKWRETGQRRSDEIVGIWVKILGNITKFGNEKHAVLEQMFFAALDCHQYKTACVCLAMLSDDFPDSMRVMRYNATLLEAQERYDDALEILDNIIKADETNSAARKRRIAILKARGQTNEAMKELVDYLKKFMSDVEAWQELCEMYLQVQDYSRAAFCAEELILHQPHNHLLQQRLADIRYTMGGVENLELAKSYYCQTLKLNPDNMRASLGLVLTTNSLLNHYKSSGNSGKRKEIWRLSQWAQSRLTKRPQSTDKLSQLMLALSVTD